MVGLKAGCIGARWVCLLVLSHCHVVLTCSFDGVSPAVNLLLIGLGAWLKLDLAEAEQAVGFGHVIVHVSQLPEPQGLPGFIWQSQM